MSSSAFAGWDFENIWDIRESQSYPFLRNVTDPQHEIGLPNHIFAITDESTNITSNSAVLSEYISDSSEYVNFSGSTQSGAAYFTYDVFNRLTGVMSAEVEAQYTYRPDGLRLSKTVNGVRTTHIWDGANMVAELDNDGNVKDVYIRGRGLIRNGQNQWFLFNARGDVIALTDAAGNVIREDRYDAFGNEQTQTLTTPTHGVTPGSILTSRAAESTFGRDFIIREQVDSHSLIHIGIYIT